MLAQRITVTPKSIRLSDSPGGIAAHLPRWPQRPDLRLAEPLQLGADFLHWAPGLVVVSNSALLSHCLAGDTTSPAMNPDWLEDILIGKGSLFEHTQFAGHFLVVPSRRSLCISRDGDIALVDFPLNVPHHDLPQDSKVAVEEVAHELVRLHRR